MSLRKLSLIAILSTAVMAPLAATADMAYHFDNVVGDVVSYTYHPEHDRSTKTRAQVLAELSTARQNGSLMFGQGDVLLFSAPKSTGPVRAREEVRQEAIEASKAGVLSRGDVVLIR